LPDGRLIRLELHFGPSVVMIASEFADHDALAPSTTGCTWAVFYLDVSDVDELWRRALEAGASVHRPLADTFWGDREGQIVDPSVTAGDSQSTSTTSAWRRCPGWPPRHLGRRRADRKTGGRVARGTTALSRDRLSHVAAL
jgi:hypothetical protein